MYCICMCRNKNMHIIISYLSYYWVPYPRVRRRGKDRSPAPTPPPGSGHFFPSGSAGSFFQSVKKHPLMSWETWHLVSYRLVIVVIKYDHIHIWYIYIHIYMWCIFYVLCSFGWILFPSPSMKHHCRKNGGFCCLRKLHFSMESRLKPPKLLVFQGGAAMIVCYFWSDKFIPFGENVYARLLHQPFIKHLFGLLFFLETFKTWTSRLRPNQIDSQWIFFCPSQPRFSWLWSWHRDVTWGNWW